MEKRRLLQKEEGLLGFGCMRFPTQADGTIDLKETFSMLDMAYENGVTYYDTAYPYHAQQSEVTLGLWQETKKRDTLRIASKMPIWCVDSAQEAQELFSNQLQRLRVDSIDYYLLHALNAERWEKAKKIGLLDLVDQWHEEGKIGSIGFSFHDEYPVFEEIIKARKWDFCQIQLNYMDTQVQAGLKGYNLAESMGIPMIVMEPVKGGRLSRLPEEVESRLKKSHPDWSPSAWALRWVASLHNVAVILSGMSTMDQVRDNLTTFTSPWMTGKDLADIHFTAKELAARKAVSCTGCGYCQPCPAGVAIPDIFSRYNDIAMYDNAVQARREYAQMDEKQRASVCVKCGKCESLCPQGLKIPELLDRAHEILIQE